MDIARDTLIYRRTKAGLALKRAMLTIAVAIIEGLHLPRAADALSAMRKEEEKLERWADDFNEQSRCILCRETPMSPDHEHIPMVM